MWMQNAGRTEERRAQVRYSHKLKTSYRRLGNETGAPWSATIQDLSLTGAALAMGHEVRPGAVLVVALEGLGGRFSRPLLMRVLHVRPMESGCWQAGCSFVKPLTDDDMQAMLLARPPA
jgi:hypothetical protein